MEEQEHAQPRYILIWVILLVLTLAELGYAFLDLPKVVLAVGLVFMAVWKAVMVAMYYMHLRYEPARLWILAISPLPLAVSSSATASAGSKGRRADRGASRLLWRATSRRWKGSWSSATTLMAWR